MVFWAFFCTGIADCHRHIQSNESAAIGNLRTIVGAETAYYSSKGTYTGNWADMTDVTPPYLDGNWTTTKQGYDFTLTAIENGKGYEVVAVPHTKATLVKKLFFVTSVRGFFTDTSGVIRANADGLESKPSAASSPIGE
jgi:hypothetical protein